MPESLKTAQTQNHNATINWDGFSELPKESLDYLLDTTAINKKLRDNRDCPYRWRTGSFQVPKSTSEETFKRVCKEKIDTWLNVFSKQGWELASKVQVYPGHATAYDIDLGLPILDKREICVRAIFKTHPKPVLIEVPATSVKRAGQTVSLETVMKGEGITPVPRRLRPQH